jgi:hypothetical protein
VPNHARDSGALVKIATFTFFPGGQAAGSTIRLGTLKAGWRLRGMRVVCPAIGAASTTISLGVAGSVAKYMAAQLVDQPLTAGRWTSGGVPDIACNTTAATFFGELLTSDVELIATTAAGSLLTSAVNQLIVNVRYTRG